MATISPIKSLENKHKVYRGKNCLKNSCQSLKEQTIKIILKRKNEVINKISVEVI